VCVPCRSWRDARQCPENYSFVLRETPEVRYSGGARMAKIAAD
jgi:hypothetical protein